MTAERAPSSQPTPLPRGLLLQVESELPSAGPRRQEQPVGPGALCPGPSVHLTLCLPAAQETRPLQARRSHQKQRGGFLCPPLPGSVHPFIHSPFIEHLPTVEKGTTGPEGPRRSGGVGCFGEGTTLDPRPLCPGPGPLVRRSSGPRQLDWVQRLQQRVQGRIGAPGGPRVEHRRS